jgi:hypothetical protein
MGIGQLERTLWDQLESNFFHRRKRSHQEVRRDCLSTLLKQLATTRSLRRMYRRLATRLQDFELAEEFRRFADQMRDHDERLSGRIQHWGGNPETVESRCPVPEEDIYRELARIVQRQFLLIYRYHEQLLDAGDVIHRSFFERLEYEIEQQRKRTLDIATSAIELLPAQTS